MEIECHYTEPPHIHSFPDDWIFGGANGLHPGADPRREPTTYEYLNDRLEVIHTTQVPLCDDQAIDEFTRVANWGPKMNPVWLSVRRPDGTTEILPFWYDKKTDTAYSRET